MNNEQPVLDKAQKRFIWKVRKIVIESSPPITERQRTAFMRKWWSFGSYDNYTADVARKHLRECEINIDITPIELCTPMMGDNATLGGDSAYCFASIVAECILFSKTLRI